MATKPDDDVDELSKKVQELDMAGSPAATGNDDPSSNLTTEGHPFKWNGSRHQLENFLKNLFSCVSYEPQKGGNKVHKFKVQPPEGTIRFFESTETLQIQGKEENKPKIKARLMEQKSVPDNKRKDRGGGESSGLRMGDTPPDSTSAESSSSSEEAISDSREIASRTISEAECEGGCCTIYGENPHIKRREHKNEPILGSRAQFCAAFYHIHEWNNHGHFCLDKNGCIIAKRAKREPNWKKQPKQVVAVAKFEDKDGKILYEAKYSNCTKKKQNNHAEDFFRKDIEDSNGVLKQLVQNNPNGTITLYITYQPCHMSIDTKTTHPKQSCCNILEGIVTQILRADGCKIDLCVKATHAHGSLDLTTKQDKNKEKLRQNAVEGIKNLMRIEGLSVSGMTPKDWAYLFSLTEYFSARQVLDNDVKQILNEISLS